MSASNRKPPSERRIVANRANALKSTGPRTPEGKARSSRNALRHGGASSAAVLPGESATERAALVTALVDDLAPVGDAERALAERYAALAWQTRRLRRAEARLTAEADAALDPDVEPSRRAGRSLADQFIVDRPGPVVRVVNMELRLQGAMGATFRRLLRLRRRRPRREVPASRYPVPAARLPAGARGAELPPAHSAAQVEPNAPGPRAADRPPAPSATRAAQDEPIPATRVGRSPASVGMPSFAVTTPLPRSYGRGAVVRAACAAVGANLGASAIASGLRVPA